MDPADGTKASDTRTFRSPREIMSELRRAYTAGTQVRLHYVDYAGATSHDWISIVMMTLHHLRGARIHRGEPHDPTPPHRCGGRAVLEVSQVLFRLMKPVLKQRTEHNARRCQSFRNIDYLIKPTTVGFTPSIPTRGLSDKMCVRNR